MLLELGRSILFATLFLIIQLLLDVALGHNSSVAKEMALLTSIGFGLGFFIRWCLYEEVKKE